jgi:hypothetical protein
MHVVDPNDLWVGGANSEVWRWDGGNWQAGVSTGLPVDFDFEALDGPDANTLWATGTGNGVYAWDGNTWALELGTTNIRDVYGTAPDDVWATVNHEIFHRDDNGWSLYNDDPPFVTIYALGEVAGEIWIAGPDDSGQGKITAARHNGGAWLDVSPPNHVGVIYDLWGSGPDDVWLVGAGVGNVPKVWRWDGGQWFDIPIASINPLFGVWGDGQGETYVAGRNLHRWTGLAMEQIVIADSNFDDVFGVAPDDVWLAAGDKSWHFDGNTWTQVPVPNNYTLSQIHGLASDDLWGTGAGGVLHWDGNTWQAAGLSGVGVGVVERGPSDVLVGLTSPPRIAHWDGFVWTEYPQHADTRRLLVSGGVSYFAGIEGLLYQP